MMNTDSLCKTLVEFEEGLKASAAVVRERLGEADICIVLGSGLNSFADTAFGDDKKELSYSEIPNMPETAVAGHYGKCVYGTVHGKRVLCFAGRFHSYEGYPGYVVSFLPRLASLVGCKLYMLTNAAGGAGEGMHPGCGMAITDHAQFVKWNALADTRYRSVEGSGASAPHIVSEDGIYSQRLVDMARDIAKEIDFPFYEGTYWWLSGPTYETPAEIRLFSALSSACGPSRTFGMSSVPEAQAAADCGMEVFGMSLVTNLASGLGHDELTHEEVSIVAKTAASGVQKLVEEIVRRVEIADCTTTVERKDAAAHDAIPAAVREGSMLPPTFMPPTTEQIAKDVKLIQGLGDLTDVTTIVYSAGAVPAEGKTAKVTEFAGFCGGRPLTASGVSATVSVETVANERVLLISAPTEEGLHFYEVAPVLVAAASAGLTTVVSAVKVFPLVEASETPIFTSYFNLVQDNLCPQLPHVRDAAPIANDAQSVAVFPGPSVPAHFMRTFASQLNCSFGTIAGLAPMTIAGQVGLTAVAAGFVEATEAAGAIKSAMDKRPATKPCPVEVTSDAVEVSYHLYNPTMGDEETVNAAVETARATLEVAKDATLVLATDVEAVMTAAGLTETVTAAGLTVAPSKPEFVFATLEAFTEGHNVGEQTVALRVARALGAAKVLIATPAVAVKEGVTRVVPIDHINLTGESPLRGVNVDAWGTRFPDCTHIYEHDFARSVRSIGGASDGLASILLQSEKNISATERKAIAEKFNSSVVIPEGYLLVALVARHAGLEIAVAADVEETSLVNWVAEVIKA